MSDVLKTLLSGNRAFVASGATKEPDYLPLAQGQSPQALVITCSDSRVNPDLIFNTKPGTLFCVRNIAGFVPTWETGGKDATLAAIEFAVDGLEIPSVIVMTHSGCKGIAYGSSPRPDGFAAAHPNLSQWLDAMGLPVSDYEMPDIEQRAAQLSYQNLIGIPCVDRAIKNRDLETAALHFDIATGCVTPVVRAF